MTPPHPSSRPTDADHLSTDADHLSTDADTLSTDADLPTSLLSQPWVDPHNHAHTLSWRDRERYALAGCEAMVMVASGAHWTPYRPVRAADVRYLWDHAINRRLAIERDHFFDATLAVGAPTRIRIEDPDALFDAMGEYCALEEVVAVGETGVTPSQHVSSWSVAGQVAAVRTQMAIAERHDLPVLVHTPNAAIGRDRGYRPGLGVPGYENNRSLAQEPVIDAEDPALEAVRLDVEAADDAGIDDRRVVASHADPNNLEFLFEETDWWVSFTLGHSWLTGVTAGTVADAIDAYGPDRILVETDCANVIRSDALSIKRAMLELYRLGVDEVAIRRVVSENPREVFDLAA